MPIQDRAADIKPDKIRAELAFSDTCTAAGITARGHAPALALCRQLLDAGHDPATRLQCWRGSTLCLTVRSIGEGARLEISDDPPRFKRRREPVAAPPIAFSESYDLAVMELAE
jgi:hypothetical protein